MAGSLVLAVILCAWPASAEFRHVRSARADVRALLRAGYDRSLTFRSLVDEIESLPGIVYIDTSIALSRDLDGALLTATAGSRDLPILRVLIRSTLSGDYRIATIAHELAHVVELLRSGARRPDEISGLFATLDSPVGRAGRRFETEAARDVTKQVLIELAGGKATGSPRHRRRLLSSSSVRFRCSSFCPASPSLPSAVRRW